MSHKNEFEDDPPTVIDRPSNYLVDLPKVEIRVDPYEGLKARVASWIVRNRHWLDESSGLAGVLLTALLAWFITQTVR
jgi:hypothetical protein